MGLKIAESLLPGVSSEDELLFVICLIVVVTLDVITKHCVGQKPINKRETRRCRMDVDPVVTLTAVSELRKSVPRLCVDPLSNADVSPASVAFQGGKVRF